MEREHSKPVLLAILALILTLAITLCSPLQAELTSSQGNSGVGPGNYGASIAYGSDVHRSGLPIGRKFWVGRSDRPLVPEIRALFSQLRPGDAIIVRDGTYHLKDDVLEWPSWASGTEASPIYLLAKHAGRARITGSLEWRLQGKHLHVSGFRFVETTGPVVLEGNDSRFTRNTFERTEAGLGIYASRVEVDNNIWIGSRGQSLWHAQPQINCGNKCRYFKYNRIHHNTWRNIDKSKSNGLEPIMLGYGYAPLPSGYDNGTHARIDHNVFSKVSGDGEVISVKSDSNTIERNCVVNSGAAAMVIRMGSDNRISNNEILGSSSTAIRISGKSNVIEGNLFDTWNAYAAGVGLHSTEKKASNSKYYRYLAAENNRITGNTFKGYKFSVRDLPASGILIKPAANNAIQYNRFTATGSKEPEVRADRNRNEAAFLRANSVKENHASSSSAAATSHCPG